MVGKKISFLTGEAFRELVALWGRFIKENVGREVIKNYMA